MNRANTPGAWDASQIKQPGWQHVEAAFIEGAREARANPEADEAMFRRAADGYTKRVFEEVDPTSEAALRTESWRTPWRGITPEGRRVMSRKAYLDQVPTPPEGIERTRDYIHVFLAALRDLRHDPEHVKQVLREVLDDGGAGESSDED